MTSPQDEAIARLFEKGVLASKEFLEQELDDHLLHKIELEEDLLVLNDDSVHVLSQQTTMVNWYDLDQKRVQAEKERDDELYQAHLQHFKTSTLALPPEVEEHKRALSSLETTLDEELPVGFSTLSEQPIETLSSQPDKVAYAVTVVLSFQNIPHKYTVSDFTNLFLSRHNFLENILRNRQELQNTINIHRLFDKQEKENTSIIGMIQEINETKSGNLLLTMEDQSGQVKVLVTKNRKELYLGAKELVHDEVVGVLGTFNDGIFFAEKIIWPDIPASHEYKKGPEEDFVIFLSDIHVGSTLFLKEEFTRFLRWLRGETGSEAQKNMARRVKYIFIAGDLVDGVGIYPSQEEELEIKDLKGQYAAFTELLRQIPSEKQIIICPGNHDSVHLAEPQPVFYQEFSPGLFDFPNVTLVTNPSITTIGKTSTFPGFDVLMYHGYSFDYYVANVESIRMNGGYHRSDLIMKFLLKRRHLAPSFKSTPYYPAHKEDPLLIRKIPDFFVTGHIHYCSVANYKGITMISGSCWQGKTSFQEKLGHEPEPARVPIVNLKTREIRILRF